ncbi:putative endoplasmic reticulum junction formation protein lunapark [Elsinoe fawcettii]|nr:putative endoplasmic reticulum junction formation protein lunapark [Elsinoe fawcettii]
MVKFWPFGGDDTSAAGFEKVLSSLSTKINKASAKDNRLRTQQRRYRVLWTLYSSFAYLLALLILMLVVGRSNWDVTEYTTLAGTPPLIYLVRLSIETFYNYRISGTQAYLEDLYKQRSEAIDKLKAATKYNSTQQLLDKYGGSAPKPEKTTTKEKKSPNQKPPQAPAQRTGMPPPPTANINRPLPPPSPPQGVNGIGPTDVSNPASRIQHSPQPSAEFAPNAFSQSSIPPPNQVPAAHAYDIGSSGPKWYDRIMDLILGEDETQPRNRIVLICSQCRLVNGQAPPGTRSLEAIGKWRCMACGGMNGTDSVAEKAVKEVLGSPVKSEMESVPRSPVHVEPGDEQHDDSENGADIEPVGIDESSDEKPATPAKSTARATRSQARQRKK